MTVVVLAGIGAGLGLLGVISGLRPARPWAGAVLGSLDRPNSVRQIADGPVANTWLHHRLGRRAATALDTRGLIRPNLVALTRTTRTTIEDLCAQALLGCAAGLVLPLAVVAVLGLGGVQLPLVVPAWSSLLLGAGGASLPFLVLRSEASQMRRAARVAIAAYLDLVVLSLAGGMGIESALYSGAAVAEDEFSLRVVAALELARHSGETPWNALAELGEELGVTELVELAAAVRLAGTEGARIRSTLSVKAASMRRHELADAETEANTVTERLFLPGVLLLVGFLVFVGYPAVARITGGF